MKQYLDWKVSAVCVLSQVPGGTLGVGSECDGGGWEYVVWGDKMYKVEEEKMKQLMRCH